MKIDLEELHFIALHSGFALWQLLPRLGPTEPPYFLERKPESEGPRSHSQPAWHEPLVEAHQPLVVNCLHQAVQGIFVQRAPTMGIVGLKKEKEILDIVTMEVERKQI